MGLISPVSGRETDSIVAVGNSSKIQTCSPHCRDEWDLDITGASDCGTPLAISLSDDIRNCFHRTNIFQLWHVLRERERESLVFFFFLIISSKRETQFGLWGKRGSFQRQRLTVFIVFRKYKLPGSQVFGYRGSHGIFMLPTYDADMYPMWHQSNLVEWSFCGF